MGPTASGKTALAVELVKRLPCEIISVDSAMVYRGMDIGTAKPGPEILQIAPHRLIDILDPSQPYSAGQFRTDAEREIQAIFAKGHIPLLTGGTMMYFRILQQGLANLPRANPALRAEMTARAERTGWEVLHAELAAIDPAAASRIHPNDSQRIQRALEVYQLTGKTISTWQAEGLNSDTPYPYCNVAIAPSDRAILHERIHQRFDHMLAEGFLDEVRRLHARGDLHSGLPSIRSVGYRQAWDYLEGLITHEEMREKAIAATRQLAKRQLTWLRTWPAVTWLETGDQTAIEKVIKLIQP